MVMPERKSGEVNIAKGRSPEMRSLYGTATGVCPFGWEGFTVGVERRGPGAVDVRCGVCGCVGAGKRKGGDCRLWTTVRGCDLCLLCGRRTCYMDIVFSVKIIPDSGADRSVLSHCQWRGGGTVHN